MKTYTNRITEITVVPDGEPIFSERATRIKIEDEAGGEFVIIEQTFGTTGENQVRIDPEEWPNIRTAVENMIARCNQPK